MVSGSSEIFSSPSLLRSAAPGPALCAFQAQGPLWGLSGAASAPPPASHEDRQTAGARGFPFLPSTPRPQRLEPWPCVPTCSRPRPPPRDGLAHTFPHSADGECCAILSPHGSIFFFFFCKDHLLPAPAQMIQLEPTHSILSRLQTVPGTRVSQSPS